MASSISYVLISPEADGDVEQDSGWYYEPKAGNHETLSTSEMFSTRHNALRAIKDAYPGVPIYEEINGELTLVVVRDDGV